MATRSGGGPSPSVTPTPTPSGTVTPTPTLSPTPTGTASGNGVATASSLQFSIDVSSGGSLQETYTYYMKNIGASSAMVRIEATGSQSNYTYIINGAQQKAWIYENGTWTDLSSDFSGELSTWNSQFAGYENDLVNWPGYGYWTYTAPDGTTLRFYGITVNPSLADSLFSPS